MNEISVLARFATADVAPAELRRQVLLFEMRALLAREARVRLVVELLMMLAFVMLVAAVIRFSPLFGITAVTSALNSTTAYPVAITIAGSALASCAVMLWLARQRRVRSEMRLLEMRIEQMQFDQSSRRE